MSADSSPPPFPDSICHRCIHHRLVRGARSTFVHCEAPGMPKYPRQPVTSCPAFTPGGSQDEPAD